MSRFSSGSGALPRFQVIAVWLATLAYPLAVYLGLGRVAPAWLACGLVVLALLRAWVARDTVWLYAALGAGFLAGASVMGGGWLPLKLYPVVVSAVMLLVFGASVLHPPTVIERIARLRQPGLPPEGVAYTRKVTLVWCAFFVCNGLVALATALWASSELWLLYNGAVSYVLMGVLFAGEWLVRRRLMSLPRAAAVSQEQNHV